jgi:predicted transcriptional regulator
MMLALPTGGPRGPGENESPAGPPAAEPRRGGRMEIRRAGEIMIPLDKYPHLPYWFTLRQAIAEMEKSQLDINGLMSLPRYVLVFDEAYKLLGIVRRRDIMRGLEPQFLTPTPTRHPKRLFDVEVDPNLSELSWDKIVKSIRERSERPVSEVMTPITVTVDARDHLMKVVNELVAHDLSLVPVTREGRVVGVVRTVDVLHELAKIVL